MIKSNNIFRKIFAIILLLSLWFLFGCGSHRTDNPPQKAKNGVLDLTNWDFEQDGPLDLKGEWKFKWMEDEPEFTNPDYNDSKWDLIKAPGYWDKKVKTGQGYGWYRLKVKLPKLKGSDNYQHLGLYLEKVHTAYQLYINGQLVMKNGRAGNAKEQSQPQLLPLIKQIPGTIHNGQMVIALKIANFHHRSGGMNTGLRLGYFDHIQSDFWQHDVKQLVLR